MCIMDFTAKTKIGAGYKILVLVGQYPPIADSLQSIPGTLPPTAIAMFRNYVRLCQIHVPF